MTVLRLTAAALVAAAGIAGSAAQPTTPPAPALLPVTVAAETATKVTLTWTPPAAVYGYVFQVDGRRVSNSWDPARAQVTFGKPGPGSHSYAVVAVTAAAAGTVTLPVPTFANQTAYTATRAAFAAARTIRVTSQAQLDTAIANLRSGDLVTNTSAAGFDVTGETVIAKQLAVPGAVIDLGTGSHAARLDYSGAQNLPTVWIHDTANVTVYGGDISNPAGGPGVLVYAASHLTWWGFRIHDTGGSGLAMFPIGGAIDHTDLAGDISNWGQQLAWDPHAEKGTGLHAAILADANTSYAFTNNRLALDVHDGAAGAAVEIGDPDGSAIAGNTLYLRAQRLSFDAQQQVAGNALQLWGSSPVGLDVGYLEARNLSGRAVDANGAAASMAGVTVRYGRVSNCCTNPALATTEPGVAPTEPWDPRAGVTYGDVAYG